MTRTSIEWATDSWNPIAAYDRETGKRGWFCTKVSPGCTNCYAEVINRRLGNGHLYRVGNVDKVRFELAPTLNDPLHWRKPRRVFVNSMTDLFLEQHTDEMIHRVYGVISCAYRHQFLILTKRPERMLAFAAVYGTPRNAWLGVSVENQEQADERIPLLLQTDAAIRFLSCEPLLSPLNLTAYFWAGVHPGERKWRTTPSALHWVIVGGESGAKARQCDLAWIRDITVECRDSGVACFVKQLGSNPVDPLADTGALILDREPAKPQFKDSRGGNPDEWPMELRVRNYPRELASV